MSAEFNVDEVFSKLNLANKVKLLAGLGWWHTEPVNQPKEGLKIEPVRMSDGPNGVRGTRFFNGVPSSCFPCSTGLGSSFDVKLARTVGKALADECKAKGCHILLGPTCNTQRPPLGGRGFESFSEDPHLNGHIAAEYINGLQAEKVAATIKHFAGNDQEFERFSISSDVSERAFREIYLMPFQIAIKHSNPWALMTAYNRINGIHASENMWLLRDVLREEWGYKGMVMSDWTGVYSTDAAIKAGLDLEMPGPGAMRGAAVHRALVGEKLFTEDIDDCVRRILEIIKIAYDSGIPFNKPEEGVDTPEVRALLRRACADATVLLKNEKGILPIKPSGKIAVIGPNAKYAVISGGGSASLRPTYTVSPLEGILAAAPDAQVSYNVGTLSHQFLPVADPYISAKDTKDLTTNTIAKGKLDFWNEEPAPGFTQGEKLGSIAEPAFTTPANSANIFLSDGIDDTKVNDICWLRWTTGFTPDEDGDWEFGLVIAGRGTMLLDGKPFIDLTHPEQGEAFFGLGTAEVRKVLRLEKGREYQLEVRICNAEFIERGSPFSCRGGIRFGAIRNVDLDVAMQEAVDAAEAADVAVLVIGLNNDWESEGYDREHMDLPGRTDELVTKVLAANPNTVVVNQSGTPVTMPWVDEAHTLVQAFYGGNEVGNGLADVLFGKVNPSAKLPLTFPKRLADNPSYPSFGNKPQAHGKILYNEGVFVGYRGFEIKDIEPLFAFGHGLSYTTFEYSDLNISKSGDDEAAFTASFTVKNTGKVAGREAAQVYVTDVASSLPRPKKELKAFAKTGVLEPGQEETLTVALDKYAFSFWDERKGTWLAEKGAFEILVGASSKDIKLQGKLELSRTIAWKGL